MALYNVTTTALLDIQVRDFDDKFTVERAIGYTFKNHMSRDFRAVHLST